jgi:hypothetical protein
MGQGGFEEGSPHRQRHELMGRVIDAYAHVGINIRAIAETGFPY